MTTWNSVLDMETISPAIQPRPESSAEPWTSLEDLLPAGQDDPIAAVRAGLPYAVLERVRGVRGVLGISDDLLAHALSVSERTLARRKEQGRLRPDESDRLLVLAEVARLAAQALDSLESARAWLVAPHPLLGGESPLARLDTALGAEEVRTMLYHIEHSMPA